MGRSRVADVPFPRVEGVSEHLDLESGQVCPTCTQHAKMYRRPLNRGMVRSLIAMYGEAGTDWLHLPTALDLRSREEGKLAHWGLAEEELSVREDGGRSGWWRVTDKGERFLRGTLRVPKYAFLYNNTLIGLAGDEVGVSEALGEPFDLRLIY